MGCTLDLFSVGCTCYFGNIWIGQSISQSIEQHDL